MSESSSHFLSCDWGTTSFRLRLVAAHDRQVVAETANEGGAKSINLQLASSAGPTERAEAFAAHLGKAVESLLAKSDCDHTTIPIIVSGMASSSVGWRELPYARTPFRLDGASAHVQKLALNRSPGRALPVLLVSGVATDREMMRGEETQVIGLLATSAFAKCAQDSLVILPGTHSKHIQVRDNQVIGLQTFMTGELFQMLTEHSILKFTTTTGATQLDDSAFRAGVAAARSPGLSRSLFQVRSRGVLGAQSAGANRSYLSGLLVGAELVELDHKPSAGPILLAAPSSMIGYYQLAAGSLGIDRRLTVADGVTLDRAVIEGHFRLWQQFADRLES